MKVISVIITLILVTVLQATAPTLIIPPTVSMTTVEINWTACPTSEDDAITETVWLENLTFAVAGTGRTVTVKDKQNSPVTVFTAVSLSANQVTLVSSVAGIRFGGGFRLSCSGAGVVYQFRGKVKR